MVTPSPRGVPTASSVPAGRAAPDGATGSSRGGSSGAAFGSALAALLGPTPEGPAAAVTPGPAAPGSDDGAVATERTGGAGGAGGTIVIAADAAVGPTPGTRHVEPVMTCGAPQAQEAKEPPGTKEAADAPKGPDATGLVLAGSLFVAPVAVVVADPVVPPHAPGAGSTTDAAEPCAVGPVASGAPPPSGAAGALVEEPAGGTIAGPPASVPAAGTAPAGPARPAQPTAFAAPQTFPSNVVGEPQRPALRPATAGLVVTPPAQPQAVARATAGLEAAGDAGGSPAVPVPSAAPTATVAPAAFATGGVGAQPVLTRAAPTGPARTATASAVPPATDPRAVAGQLARPVATLAAAAPGEHVLTVRVSPEHLGPLTVQAHVGPDGVRIELFSPTEAGRAAVHAALPDLRRDLAGTGLGASLEVSGRGAPAHEGPSQGGGNQGAGQQRSGDEAAATRVRVGRARADPAVPPAGTPLPAQAHARLDVLV